MTTTLRPAEPLQQRPDGGRSRTYDVCVNSRRVGSVHLATDPGFGAASGLIERLAIDEPDRRRGRGTVAALASEEVLRSWGCVEVQISVPADAEAGLRTARSLGYTERSRNMVKELPAEPPALPGGVEVRPMDADEFEVWKARAGDVFAQSWIDRGVPEDQARAKAEDSHRKYLPEGLATPGVAIHVVVADGRSAGFLWTGRIELEPGRWAAFVYDIEVEEEYRGRGYGRALMLLAERVAREAGDTRLGLHVFAGNTPAIRLYESLGYRTTYVNSAKELL
ncbi:MULTISPECIES: GNAT family N-acetyltransferase [unclassified Streptomyces]|uniref:GNAT family N-acetyltransferase n=1 Tax=unclassified Streptomyces TaxID=2593676 RepID=UPI0016604657|nr:MULTISPECIES: GNAT family N-acetyltransferase [unclassified Streptomyces]MBD0711729.1 GNAT family N-acetyltransferase [Streptomyces sp. CBMA291]MBD0717817.1 GNAT family N-acetyltransferase [Streptomyces sp. CBMA370]